MPRWLTETLNTIRFALGFGRKQNELEAEMDFHLAENIDDLVEQGMDPKEARKTALREFGGVEQIKEDCRDSWGIRIIADSCRDVRLGFRQIISHPWYSASIVIIFALGIGINTAVFTITNAMLFKPLSVTNGDRLVVVVNEVVGPEPARRGGEGGIGMSYPDFLDYAEQSETVEQFAGISRDRTVIGGFDDPSEMIYFTKVTPSLFEMIKIGPYMGRLFEEEDIQPGAEAVGLISYRYWQTQFLGETEIIGKTMYVDRQPVTIIGVLPEGERFPFGHDLYLPKQLPSGPEAISREMSWCRAVALLKPGETIESANLEFTHIASRLASAYPVTNQDVGVSLQTFSRFYHRGDVRDLLFLMMGTVGFVLLIACSNVANMMLGKNLGRRFELSIKASLGASRWQTIRLLLTESLLLSAVGGLLGMGLAHLAVGIFDRATTGVRDRSFWVDFSMDYIVLGFIVFLTLLSGIVFGLMPALKVSRSKLNMSLSEGTRASMGKGSGKLSGSLVVFQFAMTFVLLFGAGLLVRSFFIVKSVHEFIPRDELFTVRVFLPSGPGRAYEDLQDRANFRNKVVDQLAAIPGVSSAKITASLPGMGGMSRFIEIDGQPAIHPEDRIPVSLAAHSPGYLSAINLPLYEGREFSQFDTVDAPLVAIVPKSFAETYWPDESAVGKRFRDFRRPDEWYTVVGVCADVRPYGGNIDNRPLLYISYDQYLWNGLVFVVRSEISPSNLLPQIRTVIQEIDPYLPLADFGSLDQILNEQFYLNHVLGVLFLVFSILGLILASVGIYAIVSHSSLQRSEEIGIRLALGATPGRVVRLMVYKGLGFLLVGLFIGLLLAPLTSDLAPSYLRLEVGYTDPTVYVLVSSILFLIGFLACWIPARQVAHFKPAIVLRRE